MFWLRNKKKIIFDLILKTPSYLELCHTCVHVFKKYHSIKSCKNLPPAKDLFQVVAKLTAS